MSDGFEFEISPAPTDEDRAAILAAVDALLRREAELVQPAVWRLAGRTDQQVGISDLREWIPGHRRWALSARLPVGGRVFPGLYGRGDAK